jgi:hypothetical protein
MQEILGLHDFISFNAKEWKLPLPLKALPQKILRAGPKRQSQAVGG